jgi:8-oxo-dGTP pyrophosphatase MutT (NUDIX family)
VSDQGVPLTEATLCILVREEPPKYVLLGLKKAGFGAGKYGGFGGKVEEGEAVDTAALRELEEETGVRVRPEHLRYVARLKFLFPARPGWNHFVHVFLVTSWLGEPEETREMSPQWFPADDLPFDTMWQDGRHWLPRVLAGDRIWGRFTFQADNESIETMQLREWETLTA